MKIKYVEIDTDTEYIELKGRLNELENVIRLFKVKNKVLEDRLNRIKRLAEVDK